MNYKQSKLILEEVNKADKILINCHEGVDPDSVASAASLAYILKKLKKEIVIAAPELVTEKYDFIYPIKDIKILDFNSIDYDQFDLFFMVDSEDWDRVGRKDAPKNVKVVNIDHHPHNEIKAFLNILDPVASSTTEILFLVFQDWNIEIDVSLSTILLAGIYSDTGFFQFASTTARAIKIAGELLERGADFNNLVLNLKRRRDLNLIKMWGEIALRANVDERYKFSWAALPYETYKKYEMGGFSPTSEFTDLFLRVIDGVNFAVGMVEKEKGRLHLSLRARVTGFDVSEIAIELGGGGHKDAAGATVKGLSFDKAVDKVLEVARKYAKENVK